MANNLEEFAYYQTIYEDGYAWVWHDIGAEPDMYIDNTGKEVEIKESRILIPKGTHTRSVELLNSHPALFREFAEVDWRDESAILDFAKCYGCLHGVGKRGVWDREDNGHIYIPLCSTYDERGEWISEIHDMQDAIGQLDEFLNENVDPLDSANASNLAMTINGKLDIAFSAFVFQSCYDTVALRFQPRNLLGAMWLQLAQQLTGEKIMRSCEVCGKWFEVGPEANKATRKTCSDACRFKKYRRKKKAKLLLQNNGV